MNNLNAAFSTMRQVGLLARQNYLCCQNCAGYAMSTEVTKLVDNGKKKEEIKGCVFYHSQDNESKKEGGNFYLSYGVMGTKKYGDIGLPNKDVGKLVCQILSIHTVPYKWDGKSGTRILVIQDPKEEV